MSMVQFSSISRLEKVMSHARSSGVMGLYVPLTKNAISRPCGVSRHLPYAIIWQRYFENFWGKLFPGSRGTSLLDIQVNLTSPTLDTPLKQRRSGLYRIPSSEISSPGLPPPLPRRALIASSKKDSNARPASNLKGSGAEPLMNRVGSIS